MTAAAIACANRPRQDLPEPDFIAGFLAGLHAWPLWPELEKP
jgi:hypothetical protein